MSRRHPVGVSEARLPVAPAELDGQHAIDDQQNAIAARVYPQYATDAEPALNARPVDIGRRKCEMCHDARLPTTVGPAITQHEKRS